MYFTASVWSTKNKIWTLISLSISGGLFEMFYETSGLDPIKDVANVAIYGSGIVVESLLTTIPGTCLKYYNS